MLKYLKRPIALPALLFLVAAVISGCSARNIKKTPDASFKARTLKAEAIIETESGSGPGGRARIYAMSPDSFRIEVKGPFGQMVFMFASDGYTLHAFTDGVEKYYKADSPNVPLPFSSAQIVSILTGTDLRPLEEAGFTVEREESGLPARAVKETLRGPVTVVFSDYRESDGSRLPFEISIEGPGLQGLRIRYSSILQGEAFEDGFFDIEEAKEE